MKFAAAFLAMIGSAAALAAPKKGASASVSVQNMPTL